jgi:hypothetical protein
MVEPMEQVVREYYRNTNIAEERFLRGPLATVAPDALAEIRAAIDEAVDTSA